MIECENACNSIQPWVGIAGTLGLAKYVFHAWFWMKSILAATTYNWYTGGTPFLCHIHSNQWLASSDVFTSIQQDINRVPAYLRPHLPSSTTIHLIPISPIPYIQTQLTATWKARTQATLRNPRNKSFAMWNDNHPAHWVARIRTRIIATSAGAVESRMKLMGGRDADLRRRDRGVAVVAVRQRGWRIRGRDPRWGERVKGSLIIGMLISEEVVYSKGRE